MKKIIITIAALNSIIILNAMENNPETLHDHLSKIKVSTSAHTNTHGSTINIATIESLNPNHQFLIEQFNQIIGEQQKTIEEQTAIIDQFRRDLIAKDAHIHELEIEKIRHLENISSSNQKINELMIQNRTLYTRIENLKKQLNDL